MKSFKYSSSQQPTIRVVETPHHYNYHHHHHPREGGVAAANEDSELSIFDAQKYFNETNESPNQEQEANITTQQASLCPPPTTTTSYNLPFDDLPPSLPRRISSSTAPDGFTYSNSSKNYRDRGGARSFSFPTASSEASWNSQTGLLANPPGSVPVQLRNFPNNNDGQKRESSSSWFFRLKCPCAGKKSVRVHGRGPPDSSALNNYTYPKRQNQKPEVEKVAIKPQIIATAKELTDPISLQGANHNSAPPPNVIQHRQQRLSASGTGNPFCDGNSVAFSFPILNQTFPAPAPKMEVLRRVIPPLLAGDDPPRESLEVFQPQGDSIPSNSLLLPNHGGGGIGRGLPFLGSPTKATRDEDVASDASSDLFEIESFSTQQTSSTYPMYYYQRRDSLDEATAFNARRRLTAATGGGVASGSSFCRRSIDEEVINESEYCYEPSEASIDWSVTTAEGFDRASMTNFSITASEMEEPPITRQEWEVRGGGMEVGKGKSSKTKGIGLLSCRHEKSVVSVGPQPMKCTAEEGQAAAAGAAVGPPQPFQFITTLRHVSGRPTNPPSKPPLVGTSHSARLSLAFAA